MPDLCSSLVSVVFCIGATLVMGSAQVVSVAWVWLCAQLIAHTVTECSLYLCRMLRLPVLSATSALLDFHALYCSSTRPGSRLCKVAGVPFV